TINPNIINGLLAVAVVLMLFNVYTINDIKTSMGGTSILGASSPQKQLTGDPVQDAINAVIPTGSAGLYGESLSISFDDVTGGLDVLAALERSIKVSDLNPTQKERFITMATMPYTACEFCCGIGAAGFGRKDGSIACGCAHNLAFSGLSKYILLNHENDYTNEEIFDHIQKWKALFFPKQMIQRYMQVQEAGGDMSALEDLPGMVGGC
ncbi:MAG: hypothetical protein KAS12_02960, partial [Candidatus Aenigmarchaeota archaeon]|nr:hypothetical protein [Candidatus Aenigmarchaeota archaeon]